MATDKTTKSDNQKILQPPTDDKYGFWGTVQTYTGEEPGGRNTIDKTAADKLWAWACRSIAEKFQCNDPTAIATFLRSRYGRHLAENAAFAGGGCDEYHLVIGIGYSLDQRRRNGESVWRRSFEQVKATMKSQCHLDNGN